MSDAGTPTPGFIREAQRRAAAAAKPLSPSPTRTMTALVRAGWDFRIRGGLRMWKKDDPARPGGFWGWYSTEMAIEMQRRIDERKGS